MTKKTIKHKILFVYTEEDEYKIETLWAIKRGDNYEIDNIPFYISNIALGDIISVEVDEGELYFDDFIKESGNSTIQLVTFENIEQLEIGKEFEKLDCKWEGSDLSNYISINIPKTVNYRKVKNFLEKGFADEKWDYKEACLSESHKSQISTVS